MEYTINEKKYTQKPLVLGQVLPLIKLLEGKVIVDVSPLALVEVLGEALPQCMAVILVPEGGSVRDRDLDALSAEFADHMDLDTAMQVVSDFFSCNPLSSLSAKFRQMITGVWEKVAEKEAAPSGS